MDKKENKLMDMSTNFAVDILQLVTYLQENKVGIIPNQIGRSGTSIGANVREAQYAQGKKDFVSKLKIALKEANETAYWLELLLKTNAINKEYFENLNDKCTAIKLVLIKSCNTAQNSFKNNEA
ncbi:MAG: four helix bundle protein [Clostridia bacterium]|nr:four helix bundle protein [Clostridia bacterium]